MISFSYLSGFQLVNEELYASWITKVVAIQGKLVGEISYIFCSDEYLLGINQEYLNHDTYTDVVTFDYTQGSTIAGDIFISIDRVLENASEFRVKFDEELRRVMAHGILHLSGYGDKTDDEIKVMRIKEEDTMKMFHVEQNQNMN